ncbi:DUF4265 domain-containing protein [Actinophytocola gossypii]|uniref:DUF4265 domain-containing protein n=1 Tax=Actinophytocola gossypii TaxID=2812003 RepID=A0ABT2JKY8_9PSEU|nr:DUF4265 domain-containing protein [Actinophytocola gossypii]MCT2587964.1 DUF4265 domain-containing protein [Actinophytocola gossypii]
MTEQPRALHKIAFDLSEDAAAWARAAVEKLWVEKTDVRMEVRVRNVPFYAKGVAFGDVVRVRIDHERRQIVYEEFVSESGHSAVRLIIMDDDANSRVVDVLRAHDCWWEVDISGRLWAVDVPPPVDYAMMRSSLLRLADEGAIGFEEAALAAGHRQAAGLS